MPFPVSFDNIDITPEQLVPACGRSLTLTLRPVVNQFWGLLEREPGGLKFPALEKMRSTADWLAVGLVCVDRLSHIPVWDNPWVMSTTLVIEAL